MPRPVHASHPVNRILIVIPTALVLLLAVLPAPLAQAQGDAGTLDGWVLSGNGGTPLAGAQVTLTPAGGGTATHLVSDLNGTFHASLDPGTYVVTANASGYRSASEKVAIQSGETTPAKLTLPPAKANLTVTVADARTGDPVAGANLELWSPMGAARVTTDHDGVATLTLPSGSYRFTVQAKGYACFEGGRELAGDGNWFVALQPGTGDATVVGRVTRSDTGDPVAGVPVTLYPRGGPIYYAGASGGGSSGSGNATASNGTMEPGATTIYYPAGPSCARGTVSTTTDDAGRYRATVPNGTWTVQVSRDGFLTSQTQVVARSGETTTHDVVLQAIPPASVHVDLQVVDAATGDPLSQASVSFQNLQWGTYAYAQVDAHGHASVDLVPGYTLASAYAWTPCIEPGLKDGVASGSGSSGSSGSGTVPNSGSSSTGTSSSGAPAPTGSNGSNTVASDAAPPSDGQTTGAAMPVRCTATDAYDPLQLTRVYAAGANVSETLRMHPRPGPDATLQGYVLNATTGKPIPGATVTVWNPDVTGWGNAVTDQDGSYKMAVHSGYLLVTAWAPGSFTWEGTVTVAKGDTHRMDVSLTPGTAQYGGCCVRILAPDAGPQAVSSSGAPADLSSGGGTAGGAGHDATSSGAGPATYQDLGGGLGPYHPQSSGRGNTLVPAPGLAGVVVAALVAALALLERRRSSR